MGFVNICLMFFVFCFFVKNSLFFWSTLFSFFFLLYIEKRLPTTSYSFLFFFKCLPVWQKKKKKIKKKCQFIRWSLKNENKKKNISLLLHLRVIFSLDFCNFCNLKKILKKCVSSIPIVIICLPAKEAESVTRRKCKIDRMMNERA